MFLFQLSVHQPIFKVVSITINRFGFLILFSLLVGGNAGAECISKDGENINSGFLECTKNGNRYLGEIDQSIIKFLVGSWSTDCATMKTKIVYQLNNQGQFISQIYNFDTEGNILKSSVFLEILGLKSSGGLVYMASKSHSIEQLPSSSQTKVADYVLVVYKTIDENTRAIEDGYIIKDGVIEQEIKDGVLLKNGTKIIYFRCPEEKIAPPH